MSWEAFDKWTDRPRNVLILCVIAMFIGAGLAAIDTLSQEDTAPAVFYFCSLPYPAENENKTPLTGVNCFT